MQKDQVLFPPVDLDNLSPRASPLYQSMACYCSDNLTQNSEVRELFMHVVQFKGTRHWKTALLINGLWALVRTVLIHHFAKWMCEVMGYKLEDMLACLCSQHSVFNKPLPIPPFPYLRKGLLWNLHKRTHALLSLVFAAPLGLSDY